MPKKNPFKLDVVSIRLNKDAPLMSGHPVKSPEDAVKLIGQELCEMDREVVCIINLKSDGTPINCTFASMGALDRSVAHPRELLKATILSNASTMIMIHNHPSGNVEPSEQDIYITKRMAAVYGLMGIELMDHLIVGNEETYYSFAESREMPKNDITFNNLINQDTGLEI